MELEPTVGQLMPQECAEAADRPNLDLPATRQFRALSVLMLGSITEANQD